MVKTKALPGKRFCKKCSKMIPIHSRTCSFCNAPQYTMQQITKEYKKREKNKGKDTLSDDESFQYSNLFFTSNPFETQLPSLSAQAVPYPDPVSLNISINSFPVQIPPLSQHSSSNYSILNPCSETNSLAFSFGSPTFLSISLLSAPVLYGHIYETPGSIQIWQVTPSVQYLYSILHNGCTALDQKFFPSKENQEIGTLAVCLANGDLSIYNLPFQSYSFIYLQPISTFKIPGLVFSVLAWVDLSIAAGTQDGSIFLFKPGYPAYSQKYEAHRLPITGICYLPTRRILVTTGLDGHLKAWNLKCELIDSLCLSKRWNYHVSCNPTGRYIFFNNDAAIAPHKVIEFSQGKLESKKQLSHSNEATLSSCFSPISSFDYIATAEGEVELIYVSELEKNSKKRKTPWSRYSKVIAVDDKGNVDVGEGSEGKGVGGLRKIDLCCLGNTEIVGWVGKSCGIYVVPVEDINLVDKFE